MRVMCIGRHRFPSELLARYFGNLGVDAISCVGVDEALWRAAEERPDAVAYDYDLLASIPPSSVTPDFVFSQVPINPPSVLKWPDTTKVAEYR